MSSCHSVSLAERSNNMLNSSIVSSFWSQFQKWGEETDEGYLLLDMSAFPRFQSLIMKETLVYTRVLITTLPGDEEVFLFVGVKAEHRG